MVLMLIGGGRTPEDLREIRTDKGLLELLNIERVPSADADRAWLGRASQRQGVQGMTAVMRRMLQIQLKRDSRKEYTLDIDATAIESEKRAARMTYKGFIACRCWDIWRRTGLWLAGNSGRGTNHRIHGIYSSSNRVLRTCQKAGKSSTFVRIAQPINRKCSTGEKKMM